MQNQKGFSLIELAIVMIIIGLLIGVGVSLLPGLINQQKYTQNQSFFKPKLQCYYWLYYKKWQSAFCKQ
jgi:prepilin-type N-terminal cleavage/methylation domain-containing protein